MIRMNLACVTLAVACLVLLVDHAHALTMGGLPNGTNHGFGYEGPNGDVDGKYSSVMNGNIEEIGFKVRACCVNCPSPCTQCGIDLDVEWQIDDRNFQPVAASAGGLGSAHVRTPCQTCRTLNVDTNVNWNQAGTQNAPSARIQLTITTKCWCCATEEDFSESTTNEVMYPDD